MTDLHPIDLQEWKLIYGREELMSEDLVQVTLTPPDCDGSAVTLSWRKASKQYHHLFAGNLYAGSVMRIVPEDWRTRANDIASGISKSLARHHERHEAKPWRAWFMSDEDGGEVGHFATLDEAKGYLAEYTNSSLTAPTPTGTTPVT